MILGSRLKRLRQEIGFSQEALGAQGFVSTPGWIKLENGQRQPSEKLLGKLVEWLASERHITKAAQGPLQRELLLLKYLDARSEFVRRMAREWAAGTPWGAKLLQELRDFQPVKSRRGRPARVATAQR